MLCGGEVIEVGAKASLTPMADDVLILETGGGGGGGCGPASELPASVRARDEAEGFVGSGRNATE